MILFRISRREPGSLHAEIHVFAGPEGGTMAKLGVLNATAADVGEFVALAHVIGVVQTLPEHVRSVEIDDLR